jgi:hypothetical protein
MQVSAAKLLKLFSKQASFREVVPVPKNAPIRTPAIFGSHRQSFQESKGTFEEGLDPHREQFSLTGREQSCGFFFLGLIRRIDSIAARIAYGKSGNLDSQILQGHDFPPDEGMSNVRVLISQISDMHQASHSLVGIVIPSSIRRCLS